MPYNKASLGEVWKVALSLSIGGTELAKRKRGRRTTEKDGGSDEDATGSADQRIQMYGGDPTKVEQPGGEDSTEMKKEAQELRCTSLNGSAWSTKKKCM